MRKLTHCILFAFLLVIVPTSDLFGQIENNTMDVKAGVPYTVSDFRTRISIAPISLHSAFTPLRLVEPNVSRFIPEYKFSYMGMRFQESQKLVSSVGADIGLTFLPIGVRGKAGSLTVGVSRVVDYKISERWRFDSAGSLGYLGVFHQILPEDGQEKNLNLSAHGVYYNYSLSLLKRLGKQHSVGVSVGLNLFYVWDWKANRIADMPYSKRVGLGLYPSIGVVYNYSKF